MAGIFKNIKKGNVIAFGAGVAATLIASKVLKSKSVHNGMVKVVAKGMKVRDDAQHAFTEIKEQAEDIYEEAKAESQEPAEA